MKPTILTFVGSYLPGFKSGGPVRTISNIVDHLSDQFDLRIVTSDRDAHDPHPYPGVLVDDWNAVGEAQVYYCSPDNRSLKSLRNLINQTPHDLLYLNSCFDPTFAIKPLILRRLNLIPLQPLLIAPRGELSEGALKIKRLKKRCYIGLAQVCKLYKDAHWHASTNLEKGEIIDIMSATDEQISIAVNLPARGDIDRLGAVANRPSTDSLRIIFLSRISPKKNLDFALKVLRKISSRIHFNIYGPIDDSVYWQECQKLISKLPANVFVDYKGPIENHLVGDAMLNHDLFFFPTRGENYGHVIAEALSTGIPVLIANTTPWRELDAAGVGWDLPLSDMQGFISRIEEFARMTMEERRQMSSDAAAYARSKVYDPEIVLANRRLFAKLTQRTAK